MPRRCSHLRPWRRPCSLRLVRGSGWRVEPPRSDGVSAIDNIPWKADRGALFTLLKNLLENAIQHAPSTTTVDVEVQRDVLSVRDWGPGLDPAQIPLLFERFWRAAHRRDHGAGLGLSICQEIALAHGWSLTVERADPGLRFLLRNETM